ncbi:hypothetical protein ACFQE1_03730, partial [Halobium palmae]
PAWIDTDAIDTHLGEHAGGDGPRIAMADGGSVLADFGSESRPDAYDDERPDECDCIPGADLPCFECFRARFDDAVGGEEVAR